MTDVRLDIDKRCRPDICGDALHLPLRDSSFGGVLFTDVVEHLPDGTEAIALRELYRITAKGGRIILSTPNDVRLFTTLDPAHWVTGHRHYSAEKIVELVKDAGFEVNVSFVSGGVWDAISVLFYCLFIFPLRIVGANAQIPMRLRKLEDEEYKQTSSGYTIFVVGEKNHIP